MKTTLALGLLIVPLAQATITWDANWTDDGGPAWSGHVDVKVVGVQYEFTPTWVGPFNWIDIGSDIGDYLIQLQGQGVPLYAPVSFWAIGGLENYTVSLLKNADPDYAVFGSWTKYDDDPVVDPVPDPVPDDPKPDDPKPDDPVDDPVPDLPEPAGMAVVAGALLAYSLRRRARVLMLAALLCTLPMFAADDDPDPSVATTVSTTTQIDPGGFKVLLDVTAVQKKQGTNVASVVRIKVQKLQLVRKIQNGAQVGDTVVEVIGERDATSWLLGRTNVNGVVALNINPNKASWAAAAWNNSPQ